MDVNELFNFGKTKKLTLGAAMRNPTRVERTSSSESGSSDDEAGSTPPRRARRKRRASQRQSLASRLMQNKVIALDDSPSQEDDLRILDGTSPGAVKTPVKSPVEAELSPSPTPSPSPPPLSYITPSDGKSSDVLQKCNEALYRLKRSRPQFSTPLSDSSPNDSITVVTPQESFTLRVRCRGKIHKYSVAKVEPLSQICSQLATELGAKSEQVLLSYMTQTLEPTESPATLNLTTADIIDAIVMDEPLESTAPADVSTGSVGGSESITIRVQSAKKSITYKLSRTDPLLKAMTAFAAMLELPLSKMRFTFDGDPIDPSQTATDLGMDDDDIIDATILV